MEGRKLFFLAALHPEEVNLHPDRAEEALEPFVNLGRSDKGDLRQREAQELPQPRVRKVCCATGHIFWRSVKEHSQQMLLKNPG